MTELKKYLFLLLLGAPAFADAQGQAFPAQVTDSVSEPGSEEGEFSTKEGQKMYFSDSIHKRNFDKSEWERIRKGLDYNETKEKPPEEKPKHDNEKNDRPDYDTPEPQSDGWLGGSGLGQVLLIVVAAAALSALLFLLFRGKVSNSKVVKNEAYTIEDIEEALHESDLERYLREAIQKKEYRLAIRLYYLMAIKELSARSWITWKKDKTNNQYLFEMSQRPNYSLFREITRQFEYAWYGDMTVGEMQFQALGPYFRKFLDELKKLPD